MKNEQDMPFQSEEGSILIFLVHVWYDLKLKLFNYFFSPRRSFRDFETTHL